MLSGGKIITKERNMFEIGILFNIDDLGGGFYGWKAFKIIFQNLDPQRLTGCIIYDGDTTETLAGEAKIYCIVFQTQMESQIKYIRDVFLKHNDKGLLPRDQRLLEGSLTDKEPLVLSGQIDSDGNLVVGIDSMIGEGWVTGTKWTVKKE